MMWAGDGDGGFAASPNRLAVRIHTFHSKRDMCDKLWRPINKREIRHEQCKPKQNKTKTKNKKGPTTSDWAIPASYTRRIAEGSENICKEDKRGQ